MKTLKMFQVALVILVLSILVGCSDQVTAPRNEAPSSGGIEKQNPSVSQTQDLLSVNSFSTRIRLRPYREYTFSVLNTGLAKFNAIDVENLSIDINAGSQATGCQFFTILGYENDKYEVLGCRSKGFEWKEIKLRNASSRVLDLNVSLYGVKSRKAEIE